MSASKWRRSTPPRRRHGDDLRLDGVADMPAEEPAAAVAAEDARILERALGRTVTGAPPAVIPAEANDR